MKRMSRTTVSNALSDLGRAARASDASWALVGGLALLAHGVPRDTLDADALVESEKLTTLAHVLVGTFGWEPLVYDPATGDYVAANDVTVHFMDDPVLFDVGQERMMIPIRSSLGLHVDLIAAQHPVERSMIVLSSIRSHAGVRVPVAPLGGVLLVKAKADRVKDRAALEQAAEHLLAPSVEAALAWASRHDPTSAEDLRAILTLARARRAPSRTEAYPRKKRS